MLKNILICLSILLVTTPAFAVPVLQVGAPAGPGDVGIYADYQPSLTNPTETWTAITSGNTLLVAGAYSVKPELLLGGQYTGIEGAGQNWSDKGFDPVFDTHRAVLMATVPDGSILAGGSLTVNGADPFYFTETYENGFVVPNPPGNHDPIKNKDYLFFDIGDFAKLVLVPDFDKETLGNQIGEIKTLTFDATGFDWIHFDVFALLTDVKNNNNGGLKTDLVGNPGSHDVTAVPEPATLLLLGSGLIGIGAFVRRKFKR